MELCLFYFLNKAYLIIIIRMKNFSLTAVTAVTAKVTAVKPIIMQKKVLRSEGA
jgi:hypothetical protein